MAGSTANWNVAYGAKHLAVSMSAANWPLNAPAATVATVDGSSPVWNGFSKSSPFFFASRSRRPYISFIVLGA